MSSEGSDQNNNSTRGSLRLAPNVEELEEHKRKLPAASSSISLSIALVLIGVC
jgi:hypothetical protein